MAVKCPTKKCKGTMVQQSETEYIAADGTKFLVKYFRCQKCRNVVAVKEGEGKWITHDKEFAEQNPDKAVYVPLEEEEEEEEEAPPAEPESEPTEPSPTE